MDLDELAALVRTIPDFPKPGILFRDITTLLADAQGFSALVGGLVAVARPLDVDIVVGIEARGFVPENASSSSWRSKTNMARICVPASHR